MNKLFLSICMIVVSTICCAQELSSTGRPHFKAAMALFDAASSIEDYKQVAQEFEEVVKSDPNYADTYINLSKIYAHIGSVEGNAYFVKAKDALEKYHRLAPNDVETYEDEKVVLNSFIEKYKRSPARYVGKWKIHSVNSKTWFIDVQYAMGEYSITLNPESNSSRDNDKYEIKRIDHQTFEIIHTYMVYHDSRYYGDCDSDADSGYPTRGKYYYTYYESTFVEEIILKNNAPFYRTSRIHHEYFLDGAKTYSETIRDNLVTGIYLVRY